MIFCTPFFWSARAFFSPSEAFSGFFSLVHKKRTGPPFGTRNHEKLHEAVETTILFAVIVGCFVSLISVWVVPLMLKWMSTPDDVIGPAGEYLKIYFAGVPVLFLYNMSSAILRAVGDTKRPLNFLIISSCLNIALDILFVAKFGWGISGVAIATVIAEAVSAALACSTLMRTKEAHRLVSE